MQQRKKEPLYSIYTTRFSSFQINTEALKSVVRLQTDIKNRTATTAALKSPPYEHLTDIIFLYKNPVLFFDLISFPFFKASPSVSSTCVVPFICYRTILRVLIHVKMVVVLTSSLLIICRRSLLAAFPWII